MKSLSSRRRFGRSLRDKAHGDLNNTYRETKADNLETSSAVTCYATDL